MPEELLKIKRFEQLNVANGETRSETWASEEDAIIKYIFISSRDGNELPATFFQFGIGGRWYGVPDIVALTLGRNKLAGFELNVFLPKNVQFAYTIKNSEGSAKSYDITLVLYKT